MTKLDSELYYININCKLEKIEIQCQNDSQCMKSNHTDTHDD